MVENNFTEFVRAEVGVFQLRKGSTLSHFNATEDFQLVWDTLYMKMEMFFTYVFTVIYVL